MSIDVVSPLRQRMIEDMTARKLGAGTQRLHISNCKRFAASLSTNLRSCAVARQRAVHISPANSSRLMRCTKSAARMFAGSRQSSYGSSFPFLLRSLNVRPSTVKQRRRTMTEDGLLWCAPNGDG